MAKVSPKTKIYSNLEPTMIYYEPGENPVNIVIGKDASYYHPEAAKLEWSDDIQPFGYRGVSISLRSVNGYWMRKMRKVKQKI